MARAKSKAAATRGIARTAQKMLGEDRGKQYREWLELVPEASRKQIANRVRKSGVGDLTELAESCHEILAGVIEGTIAPVQAEAALSYAELSYQILSARDNKSTVTNVQNSMLMALFTGEKPKDLQPEYANAIDALQDGPTERPKKIAPRLKAEVGHEVGDWETYQARKAVNAK
jgi:hypothetical protein